MAKQGHRPTGIKDLLRRQTIGGFEPIATLGQAVPRLREGPSPMASGKLLATFEAVSSVADRSAVFSPDGQRVLTASADKTARLWETDSGKLLVTFPRPH